MATDELVTPELGALGRGLESRWSGAILVCSKCSKKLDGGFGRKGRTSLGKALRKRFGLKKGRKSPVGLIEVIRSLRFIWSTPDRVEDVSNGMGSTRAVGRGGGAPPGW